ncbi:hypothetical protein Moror_15463, partial [Moniliophthora roreri MCA 2997]
ATKDGKGIAPNANLSDADKAWLTIHYPGRSAVLSGVRWNLLQALDTLDVPAGVASQILLADDVSDKRGYYAELVSESGGFQTPLSTLIDEEPNLLQTLQREVTAPVVYNNQTQVVPSDDVVVGALTTGFNFLESSNAPASGTNGVEAKGQTAAKGNNTETVERTLAAVILHPSFHEAIAKIAQDDLVRRKDIKDEQTIQHSVASGSSPEVQQFILPLLLPIITQLAGSAISRLTQHGIQGNGNGVAHYPGQPLTPEVQQGIIGNAFMSILKNPAFRQIIANLVKEFLDAQQKEKSSS